MHALLAALQASHRGAISMALGLHHATLMGLKKAVLKRYLGQCPTGITLTLVMIKALLLMNRTLISIYEPL